MRCTKLVEIDYVNLENLRRFLELVGDHKFNFLNPFIFPNQTWMGFFVSFCLFVCLFAGEGLRILTYARRSLPLSSEGRSTVKQGICWKWSSSRTRDNQTFCRAFGSGAVTICFYDIGLSHTHTNTHSSACEANSLTHCATVAVDLNGLAGSNECEKKERKNSETKSQLSRFIVWSDT